MSKLIEFREKRALTQSELAEKSGVSVRTIQRIEAGAILKGHSLKAIARALDVDSAELLGDEVEGHEINYPLVKLINFSALFFFLPLGNIVVPLLVMHFTKEKNELTKQIVSVQILWTIISGLTFLVAPFIQKAFSLSRQLILVVLLAIILSNLFIIFRNAVELNKNKHLRISLKYSFI
jgi:transcriptional regulator with XRE-family HTH domain